MRLSRRTGLPSPAPKTLSPQAQARIAVICAELPTFAAEARRRIAAIPDDDEMASADG